MANGTRDRRGSRRRQLPQQHNNDVDPGQQQPVPAQKKAKNSPSRSRTTTKKREETVESEFDTQWICCECKEAECQMNPEATEMLVCDGPCRRLVHYPCAGLSALPAPEENFYCDDCTKRSHVCMICGDYGVDDSDVFLCAKPKCGLFFHESCLDMHNVRVDLTVVAPVSVKNEDDSDGGKSMPKQQRRVFVCPAHACWTCTDSDLKEAERQALSTDGLPPVGGAKIKKKMKKRRGPKGSKVGLGVFESKCDSRLLVRCCCLLCSAAVAGTVLLVDRQAPLIIIIFYNYCPLTDHP
jgi:hypothetical protein